MGQKSTGSSSKKEALNSKSLRDHPLALISAHFFFKFHSLFCFRKTSHFERKDLYSHAIVTGYKKKEESQSIT